MTQKTKKTSRAEVDKLRKEFGPIPEVDRNVIDSLCDTFMECVNCGDDTELEKEVREVFIESLTISFYVGMMEGISKGRATVVLCPYNVDCPKAKDFPEDKATN